MPFEIYYLLLNYYLLFFKLFYVNSFLLYYELLVIIYKYLDIFLKIIHVLDTIMESQKYRIAPPDAVFNLR